MTIIIDGHLLSAAEESFFHAELEHREGEYFPILYEPMQDSELNFGSFVRAISWDIHDRLMQRLISKDAINGCAPMESEIDHQSYEVDSYANASEK